MDLPVRPHATTRITGLGERQREGEELEHMCLLPCLADQA